MGLSGSGKSTLLRAVNGLNPVVRGRVRVRSGSEMVQVTGAAAPDLRDIRLRSVAMVFQQFGLLPWRTVRDNVGLGLELGGLSRRDRADKVAEQLELVGLADWADRKVGELSGGMQQRVGLARAFATDAPILLMDEPFSALDPLIRTRLQDELLDLQQKLKRTIIFVSHDLDEAFKIGNRIAIMEGGRIVQWGTPREIYTSPANDYVADFVAHMNPLGVSVRRRCDAARRCAAVTGRSARTRHWREVMAAMEADGGCNVVRDGMTLGQIQSGWRAAAPAQSRAANRAVARPRQTRTGRVPSRSIRMKSAGARGGACRSRPANRQPPPARGWPLPARLSGGAMPQVTRLRTAVGRSRSAPARVPSSSVSRPVPPQHLGAR